MRDQQQDRFDRLYRDHQQMVRNVLYNMVDRNSLDDLVQETFLKIWKGLPRFLFQSSEKTWIYRVTMNTALDFLKRPRAEFGDLKEQGVYSLETKDDKEEIQKALQEISESFRSVIVLFYFEELSYQEISKILDLPVGTVKSRLSVGREKLKEILEQKGGFHEVFRQAAR